MNFEQWTPFVTRDAIWITETDEVWIIFKSVSSWWISGRMDNTSIRIQIYSGREDYIIFHFDSFSTLFSNQIVSDREAFVLKKNLERSLSQKDKFFPLEQFDWKKEKEITIQNVKLFFYRFQSEEIYTYVRLYTIITHTRIFSSPRSSYRRTRNIFSSRTLFPPPHFTGACIIATML